MLKEGKYTLSELRAALQESEAKGEFKPKLGDGVEKDNKKNNEEAVSDITKEVSKYNGEAPKHEIAPRDDRNKTTLNVDFNFVKPGKEWTERVKVQAEGYPSEDNKKNTDVKDNGGLDYKGNEDFYKEVENNQKEHDEAKKDDMDAGLKGRELKKYNQPNQLDENKANKTSNKMKRLHFKETTFLNESQMMKRIPNEFKTDGNRFYVKDASGTEYLLECTVDKRFDYPTLKVVSKLNEAKTNSEFDRMKQLFNYNSSDYNKSVDKSNEDITSLHEQLEKVKGLEKLAD